jgi:hypothetical protein
MKAEECNDECLRNKINIITTKKSQNIHTWSCIFVEINNIDKILVKIVKRNATRIMNKKKIRYSSS